MNSPTIEIEPILDDIRVFIPQLIEACKSVSDLLYVQVNQETWHEVGQLLQGIDDLYKSVNAVSTHVANSELHAPLYPAFESFLSNMMGVFNAMNGHMDEEEYIQAADNIKHDFTSLFHQLAISLGETREVEESRFTANLAYLLQHHKFVYQSVHNIQPDPRNYRIDYARTGLPNLTVTSSDGKAIAMYSRYDPEYEAIRWCDSVSETVDHKQNVLIYGFGLGYHLLELSRRNPEYRFVIFEPDEQVLLAAMRAIDLEYLFSKMKVKEFIVGWNDVVRDESLAQFARNEKGDTAVLSIPIYDKLDIRKKLEFFEDAKTALMLYEISSRTRTHYGLPWLANKVYNLAHVLETPSIRGLRGKLKGMTAVVVGAGPSLEPDIELLRELKNHALIIAAGTSIQSLQHFGITPHLIVSIDGSEENYNAFKHLSVNDVPFLFAPLVNHKIIADKNKLFHFLFNGDMTNRYLMGWTSDDPVFSSPPSVTGPAIQAAIYMGCTEVILTGQDLSYPRDHMYSPGAKHVSQAENDFRLKHAEMQVENVEGGMNRTNDMMRVTLREIEKFLSNFPDVKFINCSRWGAKIKNTEFQPMERVLQRLKNKAVAPDLLEQAMSEHLEKYSETRRTEIKDRLYRISGRFEQLEKDMTHIQNKLRPLREQARKKPRKALDTMVEIEDIWGPIVTDELFTALIGVVIPDDVREYDRNLPELAQEKDTVRKADLFCEVLDPLIKAMKQCLPQLDMIVKEAIGRVEEKAQLAAHELSR
ncbi:DUF115 domain-containing protein [Cohnella pontilimi]|uniref:DUF115 domain-containing protein n=1 Tax=Cohnella pontilimi TaxID=2564100 RepID=A0A4U0FB89_9BACL|nr:6-hydroxymethylpterin diphosphokinase MptE-like protein [Cohnella pontilimi]TJY41957.1 DUF115 domain-containing protein [Cohnella pontilimi]